MPRTKKSKPAPKKVAPKSATRVGRGGGPNKSTFIREQPLEMSAKEVVEAAAAQGMELTEGFVYNVRSSAKKGQNAAPAPVTSKTTVPTIDDAQFRAMVVKLGTSRARELLDGVEAKLAAVVGGF